MNSKDVGKRVTSVYYGEGTIEHYERFKTRRPIIVHFDKSDTRQTFTEEGHYEAGYSSDLRNIALLEN